MTRAGQETILNDETYRVNDIDLKHFSCENPFRT